VVQVSRRTETGEAAAWKGATTENTGSNREYLREQQRSQAGCIAGRMQADLHHGLLGLIENAVAPRRLTTQLLGLFSALALTLAAIGLYGVIAQSVVQRTQEIGIRMAIGAQRRDVLGLVLLGGLRLVCLGIAIGLVGALALTRVLQTLLFGVTTHDPLTFAANAVLILAVATPACVLPAFRATRVNPIIALRAQ
jgi:putative ABC transport system permease protein